MLQFTSCIECCEDTSCLHIPIYRKKSNGSNSKDITIKLPLQQLLELDAVKHNC